MKKPSVKELLFQLKNPEIWCEEYIVRNPRNYGEYVNLAAFYKPLRDGIVFYSSAQGWRLRENWRDTIAKKRADLLAEEPHENPDSD